MKCIRCAACLNFCPVYGSVGGRAYGWVYPGPIGSVITPHFVGIEKAGQLPQASSLCGRCSEVCPVKIPIHDMLLDLRARSVESGGARFHERLSMKIFAWLASSPRLWRVLMAPGRPLYRVAVRMRLVKLPVGPLGKWSRSRELPLAGAPAFRDWWMDHGRGNQL